MHRGQGWVVGRSFSARRPEASAIIVIITIAMFIRSSDGLPAPSQMASLRMSSCSMAEDGGPSGRPSSRWAKLDSSSFAPIPVGVDAATGGRIRGGGTGDRLINSRAELLVLLGNGLAGLLRGFDTVRLPARAHGSMWTFVFCRETMLRENSCA